MIQVFIIQLRNKNGTKIPPVYPKDSLIRIVFGTYLQVFYLLHDRYRQIKYAKSSQ